MKNKNSILKSHHAEIMKETKKQTCEPTKTCNDRDKTLGPPPLHGKGLVSAVIYKATVNSATYDRKKSHIGTCQ